MQMTAIYYCESVLFCAMGGATPTRCFIEFSCGAWALITPFALALAARWPLALCLSGHLSTSLFSVLSGTETLRRALVCFQRLLIFNQEARVS